MSANQTELKFGCLLIYCIIHAFQWLGISSYDSALKLEHVVHRSIKEFTYNNYYFR